MNVKDLNGLWQEWRGVKCFLFSAIAAVTGLEQDGGQTVDRVGVDAAPGAVDIFDVLCINNLKRSPLGMDPAMIYQDQTVAVLGSQVQVMQGN